MRIVILAFVIMGFVAWSSGSLALAGGSCCAKDGCKCVSGTCCTKGACKCAGQSCCAGGVCKCGQTSCSGCKCS